MTPEVHAIEVRPGVKCLIVRDDLVPGGTKARVIHELFGDAGEYVYASPVQGYAQVALAVAARKHKKRATIFCARRQQWFKNTKLAFENGAIIQEVSPGYLTVVQARARAYCMADNRRLLPWGLDCPAIINALARIARSLGVIPPEVWCVAGSGTLSRALQAAWPTAEHRAIRIGAAPDAGKAALLVAPERFEQDAKVPPPFPSCANYDAKAWQFFAALASPGALFWNVAG